MRGTVNLDHFEGPDCVPSLSEGTPAAPETSSLQRGLDGYVATVEGRDGTMAVDHELLLERLTCLRDQLDSLLDAMARPQLGCT